MFPCFDLPQFHDQTRIELVAHIGEEDGVGSGPSGSGSHPNPKSEQQWLLLPGGPGLASTYMRALVTAINCPGRYSSIDLPGNGAHDRQFTRFDEWSRLLQNSLHKYKRGKMTLVAHSFGAIFALNIPALASIVDRLVLIGLPPIGDKRLLHHAELASKGIISRRGLPPVDEVLKNYHAQQTDAAFRQLLASDSICQYYFPPNSLRAGQQMLENLEVNHRPYDWSLQGFKPTFKLPNIPILIIGGSEDPVTPISAILDSSILDGCSNVKTCVIKDAGHFPWFDDPCGKIKEQVKEFDDNH